MLSRRALLVTPVAAAAARAALAAAGGRMTLAMHQNTSSGAGYRASLEGWARAGIKEVEITNGLLDAFLKTDTIDAARRVLTDNGLTPVSAAAGINGLLETNPNRSTLLDNLRKRCEMFAALGLTQCYITSGSNRTATLDDYKTAAAYLHEAGEIVAGYKLRVNVEALRTSTLVSTIPTLLKVVRDAAHPAVGALFDCYHFWSGLSKLGDLDLIRPGEVRHVHFQDVPDLPREMLTMTTRYIPGDGVSPLTTILHALAGKGYAGPLSVELFLPQFSRADPYDTAREIRQKAEAVMSRAGVA
jgi:2-keto-myo-inositol isomerase